MTTQTPEEAVAAVINAHILDGALHNPKLVADITALIQERERMARDGERRKHSGAPQGTKIICEKFGHIMCEGSHPFGCDWGSCPIRTLTASPSPSSKD